MCNCERRLSWKSKPHSGSFANRRFPWDDYKQDCKGRGLLLISDCTNKGFEVFQNKHQK